MPRRRKGVAERLKALDRIVKDKRPKSKVETACLRRLITDLENDGQNGLTWDEDAAAQAVGLMGFMTHWKGELAGQRFKMEPFQEHCIVAPIYGWMIETSKGIRRRYRTSYVQLGRKSGKTFLASGVAYKGLMADDEPGPEVYIASTAREQSAICFDNCKKSAERSPDLRSYLRLFAHHIECPHSDGVLRPLSADAHIMHGKNPSTVVLDEVHKHKTRDVVDSMVSGTGARRNPLIFAITQAGHDRTTICWEYYTISLGVVKADGRDAPDERWHTYIACAEQDDDIFDPRVWHKANPNLGVSIERDFMESEARKARHAVGYENTFRNAYLNMWTNQSVKWIDVERHWDPLGDEIDWSAFRGRECYVGIDLAATKDLSAMAMLFPHNGKFYLKMMFWMPEQPSTIRAESDRRQIQELARQGCIRTLPGDEADIDRIAEDIYEELSGYLVRDIAYDPWGSGVALGQKLGKMGVPHEVFCKFPQQIGTFAPAVSQIERMIDFNLLRHDRDEAMRWMIGNVAMYEDKNLNKRPDKAASAEKIDGPVSMFMAAGRWAVLNEEQPAPTYYDTVDELEIVE